MSDGTHLTQQLVSVIVPVYDVADYLVACIESLLRQTHSNLEFILIDDGSNDSSGQICDDYAAQDERIKVIHKENGGLSSARNAGLHAARGEFVCFVDSDDWVEARYVEELLRATKAAGAQIGICGYIEEHPDRKQTQRFRRDTVLSSREALLHLYSRDYLILTVMWNKIFKKDLFANELFRPGMIHEDEQIIARLLMAAPHIVCLRKPLYHYRQRPNSITGNQKRPVVLDAVIAYEDRLAWILASGTDPRLFQLTLRRLIAIMLACLTDGSVGGRQYERGVTADALIDKLAIYGPLLRPRLHPMALWSRLFIAAPSLGPVGYSWRRSARSWAGRLVRNMSRASNPSSN